MTSENSATQSDTVRDARHRPGTVEENDVDVDLLVCHVSDAKCTKAANGPDGLAFQMPVGQNIGD